MQSNPYKKLGGWLLFFVIASIAAAIVGLLAALFFFMLALAEIETTFGNVINASNAAAIFGWAGFPIILGFASFMFLIYAVHLCRRKARFLRSCQWAVTGCLMLYLFFLAISFATILSTQLLCCAPIAVGLGLLPLYFTRSVRVRTYMGSDEYLRRAWFTKKIKGPEPAVPDATPLAPMEAQHA